MFKVQYPNEFSGPMRMRVRWNSSNSRKFLLSNRVKQGGVLSSLLFSVYLDDLLCELRQVNECWMPYKWLFCGSSNLCRWHNIIRSTRSSILSMLNVCDVYAREYWYFIQSGENQLYIFPSISQFTSRTSITLYGHWHCICTFLGISVFSHDISDRNIPKSVQKLYRRYNEVMSDFKSLSRNVKSQLFSTFCFFLQGRILLRKFSKKIYIIL